MPTAKQYSQNSHHTLLLQGLAGGGKSSLSMSAPPPIAVLCVDKPAPATLPPATPGYDPSAVFYTAYPPPETILTDEKAKRDRSVADHILADLMAVKNAFVTGAKEFKVATHVGEELWPLPRTLLVEGGDFIVEHVENWILNTHGKASMDEFDNNFVGYQMRYKKLAQIYNLLTALPAAGFCNVVLTTGLHEESKMQLNSKGQQELVKTGQVDPELGGKFNTDGPRKFINSWLCLTEADKWWVVTKPTDKYKRYRGVRSGSFDLASVVEVTINPKQPINVWQKLFGEAK
jgi:hypothetical protein